LVLIMLALIVVILGKVILLDQRSYLSN
jgi:hypothetical protein